MESILYGRYRRINKQKLVTIDLDAKDLGLIYKAIAHDDNHPDFDLLRKTKQALTEYLQFDFSQRLIDNRSGWSYLPPEYRQKINTKQIYQITLLDSAWRDIETILQYIYDQKEHCSRVGGSFFIAITLAIIQKKIT